ncbi:MAG: hypothetical protein JWP03_4074, partial [Phycisphaerales bacterium]|nr:hypothetical protein [Phycisphaerales bacterium]
YGDNKPVLTASVAPNATTGIGKVTLHWTTEVASDLINDQAYVELSQDGLNWSLVTAPSNLNVPPGFYGFVRIATRTPFGSGTDLKISPYSDAVVVDNRATLPAPSLNSTGTVYPNMVPLAWSVTGPDVNRSNPTSAVRASKRPSR